MRQLGDHGVTRLAAHTILHQLAFGICGAFSAVFLLRTGLTPAQIFLTLTVMLAVRFACRPLVLVLAPLLGLRALLMVGTCLSAIQYPLLARVQGVDAALLLFCVVTAVANTFYWTSYHAFFSVVGNAERRGRQVGIRQVLAAGAGVLGPLAGGTILTLSGPWVAFGTAALVELTAIVPLLGMAAPIVPPRAPPGAYTASRMSVLLFATDAWIMSTAVPAWSIIMFEALGGRYDVFGGALALATLAGTLGGMILGRTIDRGHVRRAVWINAAVVSASLAMRVFCGSDPVSVFVVAVLASLLGGTYIPSLMTAVYNEAKAAPCAFRSQFAAEGSWDVSGAVASLIAATIAAHGVPLQWAIMLAFPAVAAQAVLLGSSYARRQGHLSAATAPPAI